MSSLILNIFAHVTETERKFIHTTKICPFISLFQIELCYSFAAINTFYSRVNTVDMLFNTFKNAYV